MDGTAFSAKLIQGGGSLPDSAEAYANTGLTVQQLTLRAGDSVDRVAVSSPGAAGGNGRVSVLAPLFTSTENQYGPSVPDPDGNGDGFGFSVNKVTNPVK
ncbi:MAG: hypothetical protein IPL43_07080 [Micropruina sp.]|nr:hypothetical protein [Micropruina sp.]